MLDFSNLKNIISGNTHMRLSDYFANA